MTEELVMITRLSGDGEVIEWFRVLREANEAAADPAMFADQLRERAGMFDPTMVEEFLQVLANAGDTERAVAELLDLESRMPDLYWAYHPRAEEEPVEQTPFGWVDDSQAAQLAAAWGGDWQTHLGPQLAPRWGDDWQSHPDDHKHAWLTDLLPELLGGGGTEPEAADADPFGWLHEEHAQRLADAWGGDWQTHLSAQLAPRWGDDWQSHPAEHKQAWFADLLPELLPEPGAVAESEVEVAEPTAAAVPEEVQQEASVLLDQILEEELSSLDADGDLSEAELNDALAELRAELLSTPATQEG